MKNALIFGAGNVGRGFIAQLFSEAGMFVHFFDMSQPLIEAINEEEAYPHFTINSEGRTEAWIKPVHADYSNNQEAVNTAVIEADIIATSVGARVLPIIAPSLALALEQRILAGRPPINILFCENWHGVAETMRELFHQALNIVDKVRFDEQVGLLTTSIGRMIPAPSEALSRIHPAAIQVEAYKFLPYDFAAVRGLMPAIPYLVGDSTIDFLFYADRKLYVHNMGHCLCAYLGDYFSFEYIWQSIAKPAIRYFVQAAMNQSAKALAKKYQTDERLVIAHVGDLLYRFSNKVLADTNERVGRDVKRKLAAGDRFLGAFETCLTENCPADFVSIGVAVGLRKLKAEMGWNSDQAVWDYLSAQQLHGLSDSHQSDALLLLKKQYQALEEGVSFEKMIKILDDQYIGAKII